MTDERPTDGTGEEPAGSDGRGVPREFLIETVRRSSLLTELRSASAAPGELAGSLEISRSTVHRAINSLEDDDLVRKGDGVYELTGLGRVVADEVDTYRRRVETATALEPFLNTVEFDEIPLEYFAEAEVTEPTARRPHRSVGRILELFGRSEEIRILTTIISPFYVDVALREMLEGTEIEVVFDDQALEIVFDEYGREAREALETGRFDVYEHSNLPFELFAFDDRLGLAAHDERGIARVFVETASPDAVQWGATLFERYLEEAEPLTTATE